MNTQSEDTSRIDTYAIVADIMGGSNGYAGYAKQIKETSPELFEKVRAGDLTLSKALEELNGPANDPQATPIKSVRQKLKKLLRNPDMAPAIVDRLETLVGEFWQ